MLNISNKPLNQKVPLSGFKSYQRSFNKDYFKYFNRFLGIFAIIGIIVLFLPWTQNVSGKGYVTTLKPDQRPQTIQSPIPGRIEKWFVREGDSVKKGDTILFISEIKNEYQDPKLLQRTALQKNAKSSSVISYSEKIQALSTQIQALKKELKLKLAQAENKLQQAKLKIVSDSIDLQAINTNLKIAERQFNRTKQLNTEGLKSLTDVENKRLKLQEMQAKAVSQQNKLLTSRNELLNYSIEINRIKAQYSDKISKAKSDKSSAESNKYETQAQVAKLESQYSNYEIRNDLYYVKAPQDGIINKAIIGGIGETFKEGEKLVKIMPTQIDIAVETYVDPIDLPLIHKGEDVQIQFDGWPAIFFSGWPNASFGTFQGKVIAIETFISENGKFRILIAPSEKRGWPNGIRVGSGAYTIALLEDVPIWYELWRQLNGFPPNYYQPDNNEKNTKPEKSK